jgi:hypothetical protein
MNKKINEYGIIINNDNTVLIQDSGYGISITNSAENIIEDLFNKKLLDNKKKCFYIDTNGNVDELIHENGKFIDFKFGFSDVEAFFEYQKK